MTGKCPGSGAMGIVDVHSKTISCQVCKQEFSLNRVNTDILRQHKAKRDPNELTLFEKRRLGLTECPTAE